MTNCASLGRSPLSKGSTGRRAKCCANQLNTWASGTNNRGGIGGLLPGGKGQDTSQQEGADSTKSDEKKKTDEEKKDKDPLDSLKGLLGGDR